MRFNHDLEPYVGYDVLCSLPIAYLGLVFILRKIMKPRAELTNLKVPMLLYNWVQVAVSGTMTYQLGKYLSFPNVFGMNNEFTAHAEYWIFIHFLSKILDMMDTVFIVLRKKDKQLSFLHVYHHASIGVVWGWLLLNGYGNGTAYYGAWINSLVHTVMYFHYGWVALGFRNPYKKYVTTLQISQFYSCMLHAVFVCIWGDEQFPLRICLLQLAYHTTMIALFTGFFKETYKKTSTVMKSIPATDITPLDVSKSGQSGVTRRDNPLPKIPGLEE